MKVSGAVAMADHVEAFGITHDLMLHMNPVKFDADPFTPSEAKVGWQPIETFPQDGVGYLVCDDRSLDGCHQVVFWDEKEDESEWRLATSDGPTFHKRAFTHWMHLPKRPSA